MMIASPMFGWTSVIGASSTPASAASATPTPNVSVTSRRVRCRTRARARVLRRGTDARPDRRPLDESTPTAQIASDDDHEQLVRRVDREAEVVAAGERVGREYGDPSGPANSRIVLDHEHQREGQQQVVDRIEPVEPAQQRRLEQHAECADHDGATSSADEDGSGRAARRSTSTNAPSMYMAPCANLTTRSIRRSPDKPSASSA